MKAKDLQKYLTNNTNGTNTNDGDYIDFENGDALHINDIQKIIDDYNALDELIDNFINENDLDNMDDRDKIVEHFKEYEDCFLRDQGYLCPLQDFALKVYKKYM